MSYGKWLPFCLGLYVLNGTMVYLESVIYLSMLLFAGKSSFVWEVHHYYTGLSLDIFKMES